MGYVPEEPYLYSHLSGLEYLVMVGQLRDLPAKPTAERIEACCACSRCTATGTCHFVLLKGMRQKVLLSPRCCTIPI